MYKINFLFLVLLFSLFSNASTKKPVDKSPKMIHLSESEQRRFDYFFYEGQKQKENWIQKTLFLLRSSAGTVTHSYLLAEMARCCLRHITP